MPMLQLVAEGDTVFTTSETCIASTTTGEVVGPAVRGAGAPMAALSVAGWQRGFSQGCDWVRSAQLAHVLLGDPSFQARWPTWRAHTRSSSMQVSKEVVEMMRGPKAVECGKTPESPYIFLHCGLHSDCSPIGPFVLLLQMARSRSSATLWTQVQQACQQLAPIFSAALNVKGRRSASHAAAGCQLCLPMAGDQHALPQCAQPSCRRTCVGAHPG